MLKKKQSLIEELKSMERVCVAFSGGVDSRFLLRTAVDVLGRDNVVAVTIASCFVTDEEIEETKAVCMELDIEHVIIPIDVLSNHDIKKNPANRCYFCKRAVFREVIKIAGRHGMVNVLEGTNADDDVDDRPGFKAIKELGVKSPLRDAGLSKPEIRAFLRDYGDPYWDKSSNACLATRIATGKEITVEDLKTVYEAEKALAEFGFKKLRVRVHGDADNLLARIEVLPEEIKLLSNKKTRLQINEYLKNLGFKYVSIDIMGYGGAI